jgi:ribosomal protein L37AE/L43A
MILLIFPAHSFATCPKCGGPLVWLEQLGVWACLVCEEGST